MVLVKDSVTVAVMTEPSTTPINIQHTPRVLPTTLRGVTSPYLRKEISMNDTAILKAKTDCVACYNETVKIKNIIYHGNCHNLILTFFVDRTDKYWPTVIRACVIYQGPILFFFM